MTGNNPFKALADGPIHQTHCCDEITGIIIILIITYTILICDLPSH
jgi:hypothetical protein